MTKIIGLLGPAGAGKSTACAHLEQKYGAVRFTLAAPLKKLIQNAFQLTDEQLYGTQDQKESIDPRYNVSPRWLMQRIGTQGIRAVLGPDFWVEYQLDQIRQHKPYLAVVDDVRFINEAKVLQDAGAKIWKINRPYKYSNADSSHQSEAEWTKAPCDMTIMNDGTVQDLKFKMDTLCSLNNITAISIFE